MKKYMFTSLLFVQASFLPVFADPFVSSGETLSMESPSAFDINPLAVGNLNLNKQGNVIVARKGERIFTTLNFFCSPAFADPEALYQIVIGYETIGPQKCIFNELGYRFEGKEGILSFFCEAPETPGIYDVQCHISSERSSAEALQSWWDQKAEESNTKVTVGRIIVK